MDEKVLLTDDQKTYILANYTRLSLKELAQKLSRDPKQNGQTKLGRAIREFLAAKGLEYETTKFVKQDEVELNKEQITFINNNRKNMKPLEMTRLMFNNEKLEPLSKEFRAVYKYLEANDPLAIPKEDLMADDDEYKAPLSIARLIPRVNKYVMKDVEAGKFLISEDIKPQEQRYLKALLNYMNVMRFTYQASQYRKKVDRELFESSYVRFCWGKDDLLEEEVDNYVSLCSEIVSSAQIERTVQNMDYQLGEMLDGSAEDKKLSITFVETLNAQREKLNSSKTRQEKLTQSLIGARSKRLESKQSENATILNLVEAVKQEETRKQLLIIAEKQKLLESGEVDKLADMDSVIALIAGFDMRRAKN